MALAFRTAALLKPEARLAQALSEFKAVLSDSQKMRLRMHQGQAPPKPHDVLKFSAELNQKAQRQVHCFGPRFQCVLEFVQRFSAVADTIIGGSQQLIASAAWGVVKLALQIASGFLAYFEELSKLFKEIGRSCPRHEEFGVLFKDHPPVQAALCEYFVSVVSLCKKVVAFSNKSSLSQFSASFLRPFDAEFATFRSELLRLSHSIRDEASLASKKAASNEVTEASKFQALSTKFRQSLSKDVRDIQLALAQQNRRIYLDGLSTYSSNQTYYRQIRKQGTTAWFQGSGKTALTANLLDYLCLSTDASQVAFHFCRFDHAESTGVKVVLGSLLRQLLEPLQLDINEKDLDSQMLDREDIVRAMLGKLPLKRTYILIIDGLDGWENRTLRELLGLLRILIKGPEHTFKIFCSCRNDLEDVVRQALVPQFQLHMMEDIREMEEYVLSSLESCLEQGDLSVQEPALVLRIKDALVGAADGMYLWVSLQIQTLCSLTSDKEITKALMDLPKDLPETYRRILLRIKAKGAPLEVIKRMYKVVLAARRPLDINELRECLKIAPGSTTWNISSLINDMRRTISSGGSLLAMNEETDTVHLAHHSVAKFFELNRDPHTAELCFDSKSAESLLGAICITYVSREYSRPQ